ncbi:MAG: ATP-binding protein [Deltaproteobacteria bacterium]|nr:ATP-binding protein [Deltaproteobacteria bacterium]
MLELSLHILDLVENCLNAGATLVTVEITEKQAENFLEIIIEDNGRGMTPEFLARATDPFTTTRTTRRVGLGLSLMQANAQAWGGGLELASQVGQGTRVRIWCELDHVDRQPLGDWAGSLVGLILTQPTVDFVYRHTVDDDDVELDTRELKEEAGAGVVQDALVMKQLAEQIREALAELGSRA